MQRNYTLYIQSSLFKGSQLNKAALTKNMYAIYMKLAYDLEDAETTL